MSFGDAIMCTKGRKREYLRTSDQLEGTQMNPKEISLEAIIWAAKEIAKENQVNAAYLMGYAQGLMDQEQTRRVCDAG